MRIAIATFSVARQDSRVLRATYALAEHGHEVHLIGFGGAPQNCPGQFYSLGRPPNHVEHRIWVAMGQFPAQLSPALTRLIAWLRPIQRRCYALLREIRPDVIHANDWPLLPIAVAVKRAVGASVIYDSHECASEEHSERLLWRLLCQPHVRATEATSIRDADRVITVSPGIARLLAQTYRLAVPPVVLTNVPPYKLAAVHQLGSTLELLYHGVLKSGRGLETLVHAMALVRRPARLLLRGSGATRYMAGIQHLATRLGKPGLVRFEQQVTFDKVVEAAACSDIGLFIPPLTTAQTKFMLPNKIFEYLMAGLMIITSDADDVSDVLRQHSCGLTLSNLTPAHLADTIDGLSYVEIEEYKTRSRKAAHLLNWEREQSKLIALYDELSDMRDCKPNAFRNSMSSQRSESRENRLAMASTPNCTAVHSPSAPTIRGDTYPTSFGN
jgi:glycogen synthase